MEIYSYHPATGEFIGASLADKDPLDDEIWLVPAHAVTTAPPSAPGKAAVWAEGAWTLVDDHRGETWFMGHGCPFVVTTLEIPVGATQTEPAAPPKYQSADAAKAAMVQWANNFTAAVTGPVPIDERLSWDAKEAAARAYIAETADTAQTAMIETEAAITEEGPASLAAIIIAKADTFRAVVARVAGLRRKTIAAIDAVVDPADYETVLLSAKAEAEALAAELGLSVTG